MGNSAIRNGILLVGFMTCVLLFIHSPLVQKVEDTTLPIQLIDLDEESATQVPNTMVSTCSDRATKRGPGQKVIAFCLYGDPPNEKYLAGIENNTAMIAEYFPGWVVRLYHDIPEKSNETLPILMSYQKRYEHLDLCSCYNIPGYGDIKGTHQMIWRFLPIADPLVDIFLSRDLDSRPSERELMALNEWWDSNLPFHVMRDNPQHGVPILGGMWGARVNMARELLLSKMAQMLIRGRVAGAKGVDQDLLRIVLWPAIKSRTMQHDSYFCKSFSGHGHMRPWPTRRLTNELNFVGSTWTSPTVYDRLTKECPLACRPPDHKHWTYC